MGTLTIKEAIQLFDRLLTTKSSALSILPFNFIFSALARMKSSQNYYATIFSLFNRLTETRRVSPSPSPDVCTYTILIGYCTQLDQPALGLIYFGRLIKAGLRANTFIFTPLLKGLCSENRINEAIALVLHKMPKLGCTPSLGKDVVSYEILLLGYAKDGNIDDVMRILDRMQLDHILPDYSTYTSLIKAFAKNRKVDDAMWLLKRMKQEGVKPDLSAYSPILKLLLRIGRVNDARDLVDQAIR